MPTIHYSLVLLVPLFSFSVRRLAITSRSILAAHLLLAMLVVQVSLGVAILLLHMPVAIAVIHQGGAILLFTIALFITREIRQEKEAER